ncbi:MAG: protein-methionine-sulfoxide reductase catalytic subunit MsrP [Pseudomonadota bacterium]|nr:protein-methionine-sulfoxide reductase catalytic subunit MsrP [Pseudomonadota bacterium]
MLIRSRKPWDVIDYKTTDENVYLNRRSLLRAIGIAGAGLASASFVGGEFAPMVSSVRAASIIGFPATRNPAFTLDRPVTEEEEATTYTNFYEFGSSKNIWRKARKLVTDPWIFTIEGLVDNPLQLDASELIARTGPQEERLYRHRCVEAWAMAVPWTGVPMSRLVKLVQPKAEAKYVRLETFFDPSVAIGQRQSWYPWPYVEGMTIDEAMNEMAFIGTGLYGRAMEKQNGAPLRIVLPWKYGFKSIKSIVKMTFTDQRPVSFWEKLAANEYGFWANVNPDVDHPRWSQATERMLGTGKRVATQIYNGYGEQVAYLYKDMKGEGDRLFR